MPKYGGYSPARIYGSASTMPRPYQFPTSIPSIYQAYGMSNPMAEGSFHGGGSSMGYGGYMFPPAPNNPLIPTPPAPTPQVPAPTPGATGTGITQYNFGQTPGGWIPVPEGTPGSVPIYDSMGRPFGFGIPYPGGQSQSQRNKVNVAARNRVKNKFVWKQQQAAVDLYQNYLSGNTGQGVGAQPNWYGQLTNFSV